MCHERWARARDEAVASSYLRDLWLREREDAQPAESSDEQATEEVAEREPLAVLPE